ncbi:MAG: peptidylprolyl isomerase [Euryarchaeota archaeon]|nr:peptidylprolyl isomerase [Euryarchaeota archaeon]
MKATVLLIETKLGTIKVELDTERAPNTSDHIVRLVKKGMYAGGCIYRSEPGFVVQGGIPDGGAPNMAWERTGLKNARGTISMARAGDPNTEESAGTGSSEFFINLAENGRLDGYKWPYVVFGKVVEGMEVVDKVAALPVRQEGRIRLLNEPIKFAVKIIVERE